MPAKLPFRMKLKTYERLIAGDDMLGKCRACGTMMINVEPDAKRNLCTCGEREVYGLEELLEREEIVLT